MQTIDRSKPPLAEEPSLPTCKIIIKNICITQRQSYTLYNRKCEQYACICMRVCAVFNHVYKWPMHSILQKWWRGVQARIKTKQMQARRQKAALILQKFWERVRRRFDGRGEGRIGKKYTRNDFGNKQPLPMRPSPINMTLICTGMRANPPPPPSPIHNCWPFQMFVQQ